MPQFGRYSEYQLPSCHRHQLFSPAVSTRPERVTGNIARSVTRGEPAQIYRGTSITGMKRSHRAVPLLPCPASGLVRQKQPAPLPEFGQYSLFVVVVGGGLLLSVNVSLQAALAPRFRAVGAMARAVEVQHQPGERLGAATQQVEALGLAYTLTMH